MLHIHFKEYRLLFQNHHSHPRGAKLVTLLHGPTYRSVWEAAGCPLTQIKALQVIRQCSQKLPCDCMCDLDKSVYFNPYHLFQSIAILWYNITTKKILERVSYLFWSPSLLTVSTRRKWDTLQSQMGIDSPFPAAVWSGVYLTQPALLKEFSCNILTLKAKFVLYIAKWVSSHLKVMN